MPLHAPAKRARITANRCARWSANGFGATVDLPYDLAIERTRAALKDQGFGVLTEIDVKQTMKAKLDVDVRPYVILGACNPTLAHRALKSDLGIGLRLPCNVVVYDNGDGSSTVEMMNPKAALGMVGDNPVIADIAREAGASLGLALDAVAAHS